MPGTSSRAFEILNEDVALRVKIYNNKAGSADLSEGEGFNIQSGTVTALADSNTVGIFGVACAKITNATYGFCWVTGIFRVGVTGTVDFALGGPAYSAGASTVDTGSASDVPIGHVVNADPANGATSVDIALCSQLLDRTAHA